MIVGNSRLVLPFLVSALALVSGPAVGGSGRCAYEISGSVSRRVGNLLEGPSRLEGVPRIPVRLLDSQAERELAETRTDAEGEFRFANLCAGTYVVCPGTPCPAGDHSRYSPPSRRLKLSSADAAGLAFELEDPGGKGGDPSDVEEPNLLDKTDDPRWAQERKAAAVVGSVVEPRTGLAEDFKEGPVLPAVDRDPELERSLAERHQSAISAMRPEARKELAEASREYLEELVKQYRKVDPRRLAHSVLKRHFSDLTKQQRDLLTLCLLAEVVEAASDRPEWDLRARKIREPLEKKRNEDEELEMLELNGLLSKRSQAMVLASQILSSSNQSQMSILNNVGN